MGGDTVGVRLPRFTQATIRIACIAARGSLRGIITSLRDSPLPSLGLFTPGFQGRQACSAAARGRDPGTNEWNFPPAPHTSLAERVRHDAVRAGLAWAAPSLCIQGVWTVSPMPTQLQGSGVWGVGEGTAHHGLE